MVFFDTLRVEIREEAVVRSTKAIYLALGVLSDGTRDIPGIWIENTEGAKFWLHVFNDLVTRDVADILHLVTFAGEQVVDAPVAEAPARVRQLDDACG
mgnify:FL=1